MTQIGVDLQGAKASGDKDHDQCIGSVADRSVVRRRWAGRRDAVPGKRGDSVFGAGWARDLATDVAAIREWGASAVVTLIEDHEFEMLGVPALHEAVRAAGLEWHHLPVQDVHAPSPEFETRWVYAGARLRERLRRGERVLVHCRGGLGRAGSVAARLLVEFGATPVDAISQVRAARPGAIETAEQEQWVLAQRPVDAVRDARSSPRLGCLLGGAIGDALGYRVEFETLAAIRAKHGEEGIRLAAATGELEVSDDTQMTLFTLEGQLRAAKDGVPLTDAIRQAYLDWYRTQNGRWNARDRSQASGLVRHAVLWQRQAPGNTCLSALHAGGHGSVEKPINDSKGCGGVMRTATLGFLGDEVDEATLYVQGAAAAALTHGHADGYAPSGVMALAVRKLLDGASWLEAIEVASNHDGDSDSTASIAGQLYGAKHGLTALPAEAVYRVDVLEALLELFAEWERVAREVTQ